MSEAERLTALADEEDAIADWIDQQRPGFFLSDDPVARYAAEGARARALAYRAFAAAASEVRA